MRKILLPLLLLFATGCGAPTFPQESVLTTLRIVGLIASEPEANPGDTVTVTPILSDFDGNGRALVYTVSTCVDPGFSFGDDQTCDGLPSQQIISPAGTTVAPLGGTNYANVAGYASPDYTGAAAAFSFAIPAAAAMFLANNGQLLPAYEQYNGVSYLIDYRLQSADGAAAVRAVKRILVSTRPTKNTNPTLTSFTGPTGATVAALPTSEGNISPVFGTTPTQYQSELSDGTFTTIGESYNVSWFSTEGNFTLDNTQGSASNTYWPPSPVPTTQHSILIGIVYDGRGGEGALLLSF